MPYTAQCSRSYRVFSLQRLLKNPRQDSVKVTKKNLFLQIRRVHHCISRPKTTSQEVIVANKRSSHARLHHTYGNLIRSSNESNKDFRLSEDHHFSLTYIGAQKHFVVTIFKWHGHWLKFFKQKFVIQNQVLETFMDVLYRFFSLRLNYHFMWDSIHTGFI